MITFNNPYEKQKNWAKINNGLIAGKLTDPVKVISMENNGNDTYIVAGYHRSSGSKTMKMYFACLSTKENLSKTIKNVGTGFKGYLHNQVGKGIISPIGSGELTGNYVTNIKYPAKINYLFDENQASRIPEENKKPVKQEVKVKAEVKTNTPGIILTEETVKTLLPTVKELNSRKTVTLNNSNQEFLSKMKQAIFG